MARLGTGVNLAEVGAQQVAHAHAVAAHLVRIGGADALARGTDFRAALGSLVSRVENPVRRQNQVCLLRDAELPRQVVAAAGQLLGLGTKQNGVEHYAVTDDVGLAALENTRGNRPQYVFLAVEFQRVAGVGSALEACHHLVAGRQYVDNLAFTLVAPLKAENDVYFLHDIRIMLLAAKDIFCIQRYEIFHEIPNSRGDFSTFGPEKRPQKVPRRRTKRLPEPTGRLTAHSAAPRAPAARHPGTPARAARNRHKKTDPGVRLFLAACVGCTATSAAPSKKIRRCTLCPALLPTPSGRQPFLVSAPARLLFPAGHAQRPASPRHPTRREEVRRPHGRQSDTTSVWLSTLRTRISCAAPL